MISEDAMDEENATFEVEETDAIDWFSVAIGKERDRSRKPDHAYSKPRHKEPEPGQKESVGVKFICEHCAIEYKTIESLNRHKIIKHGEDGKGKRVCPFPGCGNVYANVGPYKDHLNSHINVKAYKCEICEKAYRHRCDRNRHQKYCGVAVSQRLPCKDCSKTFNSRQSLSVHKQAVHSQVLYKCKVCGMGYRYASSLRKHKQKHGT